jgi:hypothetical protein
MNAIANPTMPAKQTFLDRSALPVGTFEGRADPQPVQGGSSSMKTLICCATGSDGTDRETRIVHPHKVTRTPLRRCLEVIHGLVSAIVLVLMPKCPVCLAAYVAIGTGMGLSITTATYVRASLLLLSMASLSYLAMRHTRRFRQSMRRVRSC